MGTIKINGSSDDIIEIGGDISDEFSFMSDETGYIALSDGTLVSVNYDDDGFWRLVVKRTGEGSSVALTQASDADNDYSDTIVITAEEKITFAVFGVQVAKAQ